MTKRPRNFADLARRISSRTTDLLGASILVAAMLAVGWRLTQWWRSPAPEAALAPPATLNVFDDAGRPLELTFGDAPWSMRREEYTGEERAAIARAATLMQTALNSSATGNSRPTSFPAIAQTTDAERKLIAKLAAWQPVTSGEGWRIYSVGGPFAWLVGVASESASQSAEEVTSGMAGSSRIASWGFVLPQSDGAWTVSVIDRDGRSSGAVESIVPPWPRSLRANLTATADDGTRLTTFAGDDSLASTMDAFDATLPPAGWTRAADWMRLGDSASARYQLSQADQTWETAVTIVSAGGRVSGVIETTPVTSLYTVP